MASPELSRRAEKVVGDPPHVDLDERQRREFHEAVLDADAVGRMYIAPVSFAPSSRTPARPTGRRSGLETNALYTVERVSAGLRII